MADYADVGVSMEQDKLLRKIKKLLALSKSNNPHEAASALAMAQKLMAENQLNQSQVEFSQAHAKQKTAINPPDMYTC